MFITMIAVLAKRSVFARRQPFASATVGAMNTLKMLFHLQFISTNEWLPLNWSAELVNQVMYLHRMRVSSRATLPVLMNRKVVGEFYLYSRSISWVASHA